MMSARARLISPRGARLPDREALREVVQADAHRDEERDPVRGGEALEERARCELVDGRRAGTDEVRAAPALHPAVVVDEAHQAGDEAAHEQCGEAGELTPGAVADDRLLEGLLDGLDPVGEDVPEEEDEDPGGERAQGDVEPRRRVVDPPEREPEEDREPRDRSEGDYLPGRHPLASLTITVRETLQAAAGACQRRRR